MSAQAAPAPRAFPAVAVPRTPTRRGAELFLLIFGMAVVAAYAAACTIGLTGKVRLDFWVQPLILFLMFFGMHIVIRILAPNADPILMPIVATLNGIGVEFLRRLDLGRAIKLGASYSPFSGDAFRQMLWTLVSLMVATAALWIIRDYRALARYAYSLMFLGVFLVILPAVLPARFSQINNAKLWIKFGGFFQIQPGEFAKLMLLVFFAAYLVRKRELLTLTSRRFLGIDFPNPRYLGPIVMVWLMSLAVLVFEKDLGTSLLYFGMFVVTLYIATERVSWLIIGLVLFFGGAISAYFLGEFLGPFANFHERATIWLDPFKDPTGDGYQLVQSLLGLGTGSLFGSGPGAGAPALIPAVQNDFIFAGIGEEIGLFGLTTILVMYLVIVLRGLRTAISVRDSFGKLLAGGLAFTVGLQVFVIIGGITKLIPLTGQTTPFMSAGGSSLMANWLLIALLLRISDAARKPPAPPRAEPTRLAGLATEVIS